MAGVPPAFPGFSYSWEQAQSIAGILTPLATAVAGANVSAPTQVAGLGLLIAKTIQASKMASAPEAAIDALGVYLREILSRPGPL